MKARAADRQVFRTLTRIVAMLLSLAALCERVSRRPRSIRYAVLAILLPVEALARTFILQLVEDFGCRADLTGATFLRNGDDRADAIRLALCFEALAHLLEDLLDYAGDLISLRESGTFAGGAFLPSRAARIGEVLLALTHSISVGVQGADPTPDTS